MPIRRYTQSFKHSVVNEVLETRNYNRVAKQHGIQEMTLRTWVKEAVEKCDPANPVLNGHNLAGLVFDGIAVEDLIQAYQAKKQIPKTHFDFRAKKYPLKPGCYLMKDIEGRVIYVGKAKELRTRLNSYFKAEHERKKTVELVSEIRDIEVIIVNNEAESLVLENNLIKYYRPKHNRKLMDEDSGYAYIVLTGEPRRFVLYRKKRINREWQRVKEREGEKRFGPYICAETLHEFIIDYFKLPTCQIVPDRVCLRYYLQKCSGICEGKISPAEYMEMINEAVRLLSFKHAELLHELENKMLIHAENLEFEKAQEIKNLLKSLKNTLEKQIVEREMEHDQHVVYFGDKTVLVTHIEAGMILRLQMFDLDFPAGPDDIYTQFLCKRYPEESPREIIVNTLPEPEKVEKLLSAANGYKVKITMPKQGLKYDLLKLCELNYLYRCEAAAGK